MTVHLNPLNGESATDRMKQFDLSKHFDELILLFSRNLGFYLFTVHDHIFLSRKSNLIIFLWILDFILPKHFRVFEPLSKYWAETCPNFRLVRKIHILGSHTDESRVTVTHVTSKTPIYDSDGRIYQNQPYLFVAESKYSPLLSLVSSNSRLLTGRLCFKSSSVSLLPVIPDSPL